MKKITIYMVIILIILSILFKNSFNNLLKLVYIKKDNSIVFSDTFTNAYIKSLEDNIKEYEDINSIDNCINSTIIYRNPTYWYDSFTINKGIKDNININDIVINSSGLIGIISKVYDSSSEVSLITNINNKITVGLKNDNKEIYGILDSYNKITNEFIVSELTSDIDGDINVITTNFTNKYKEGILIGKVIKIIDNSNGISKDAIVKSNINYNNIKYVCVIK